jgi:uncharacterized membrane protein
MRHRPNRIWSQLLIAVLAVVGLAALGCEESGGIGACFSEATSGGQRWCNDSLDAGECEQFNSVQHNGVSWKYHDDQTCEELGCPTGNC